MSLNAINSDDECTIVGFDPGETKILIGVVISLIAFVVLAGLISALAATGDLMRFFTLKANLSIGQGLLYIALPVISVAIAAPLTFRYCPPQKICRRNR